MLNYTISDLVSKHPQSQYVWKAEHDNDADCQSVYVRNNTWLGSFRFKWVIRDKQTQKIADTILSDTVTGEHSRDEEVHIIDDNGTITISDYIDFSYLFERVEA